MSIKPAIREQVRQRAQLACEFCGIIEADVGSQLTIDHFQPRAKGGADSLDNLIYCCASCNQYKHDYWPASPDDPSLGNPRDVAWVVGGYGSVRVSEYGSVGDRILRDSHTPILPHKITSSSPPGMPCTGSIPTPRAAAPTGRRRPAPSPFSSRRADWPLPSR